MLLFLHNSPRSFWMHCVQIWFALIACAFIFAQFNKVPLDALRTDLICTDSMCLYFCTIDQGSLMSGHMIYFANITFAPQYCTIQDPCMCCVQIGHLICFAALAYVFAFLHISPRSKIYIDVSALPIIIAGHIACGNWHPHPSIWIQWLEDCHMQVVEGSVEDN